MTSMTDEAAAPGLSKFQFIALMAMLMAVNAVSIDIMLPGLQEIGASLGVTDENHRQYVITAYLIGMGVAQLFFFDADGRRIGFGGWRHRRNHGCGVRGSYSIIANDPVGHRRHVKRRPVVRFAKTW